MSRARFGPRGAALAALLVLVSGGATRAVGQEGRDRACTLVLEPTTDSTESVSLEVEPDTYVTHVRGGLRWTCGGSRMVADSAVRYEQDGRLEMIGSVDYGDSVRTLLADRVLYFEREDRIEARGRVVLTRRATGSTLEGPRVEFLRVSGGETRRTVATGRPLLTLRRDTAASDSAPPVRVEGDRVVLLGDREARVRGDVEIRRPDMEARADSAVFRMEEETGQLWGSPEVTGDAWRLTGRTIRTRFEDGDLREVVAEEEGHASGEDFELFAPRIRARMRDQRIDRLWAYGETRPVAFSPPYRLAADSLEFAFREGEIDRLRAVDDARAVETGERIPEEPRAEVALTADGRSWVAADTITLAFGAASATGDSAAAGTAGDALEAAGRRGAPAAGRDSGAVTLLPPVDSLVDVTGGDAGAAAAASAGAAGEGDGPGPGQADGREIRTMRAVGGARAYYLLEPDEPGRRPGRHYQVGREIVVHFRGGEAVRLEGRQAVGVHLDPVDEPAARTPGGGAVGEEGRPGGAGDSVPPDTLAPGPAEPDAAPGDTAPSPRDSTPAPSDSTPPAPSDTARAAPPDSAGRAEGEGHP